MNKKQLERIHSGKGFIAALDQSGGSSPNALKAYGISKDSYNSDEEMFNLIHQMRTRIITSQSFNSEHVLGAILFEDTMNRNICEVPTAEYLWDKKGIVPFLKVDKGLEEEQDGVRLMKDMPTLDNMLQSAIEHNIFGTKMRSVIKEANELGIKKIVDQQFEIGLKIYENGLVPILEPEVDINCKEKEKAEAILKSEIIKHLSSVSENTKLIFKVTIPTKENFYSELLDYPQIIRVVALSGGYTHEKAIKLLSKNNKLIASFSRALLEGLDVNNSDAEFDEILNKSVCEVYNASK